MIISIGVSENAATSKSTGEIVIWWFLMKKPIMSGSWCPCRRKYRMTNPIRDYKQEKPVQTGDGKGCWAGLFGSFRIYLLSYCSLIYNGSSNTTIKGWWWLRAALNSSPTTSWGAATPVYFYGCLFLLDILIFVWNRKTSLNGPWCHGEMCMGLLLVATTVMNGSKKTNIVVSKWTVMMV